MSHKAIYTLYPSVITIVGDANAFDVNGNSVTIDMDAVNAWVNPEQYKLDRASAYPPITDQLDTIYHEGIDAWKAVITAVKEEYPKP